MITPDLPKPKAFLPIDDSDAKKHLVLPDKRIIRRVKKGELPYYPPRKTNVFHAKVDKNIDKDLRSEGLVYAKFVCPRCRQVIDEYITNKGLRNLTCEDCKRSFSFKI